MAIEIVMRDGDIHLKKEGNIVGFISKGRDNLRLRGFTGCEEATPSEEYLSRYNMAFKFSQPTQDVIAYQRGSGVCAVELKIRPVNMGPGFALIEFYDINSYHINNFREIHLTTSGGAALLWSVESPGSDFIEVCGYKKMELLTDVQPDPLFYVEAYLSERDVYKRIGFPCSSRDDGLQKLVVLTQEFDTRHETNFTNVAQKIYDSR